MAVDSFMDRAIGLVIVLSLIGIVVQSVVVAQADGNLSAVQITLIGLVTIVFIFGVIKYAMGKKR